MGWDQAEHGMAGDSGELFAATKGAVMAFTRSLARSLAPAGARQLRRARLDQDHLGRTGFGVLATAGQRRVAARAVGNARGRGRAWRGFWPRPRPAFVTGQMIPVNGGSKMRRLRLMHWPLA